MTNFWKHVAYQLRLAWASWFSPYCTCHHRQCAKPQVGLSIWCREHTDMILMGASVCGVDDHDLLVFPESE